MGIIDLAMIVPVLEIVDAYYAPTIEVALATASNEHASSQLACETL